ncbi:MAG TPA: DUF58 domain-containing protein, partial [Chloroflexota bacterium]|nr:DUF58 domain-containing protein [Chloroflexota bacterium]
MIGRLLRRGRPAAGALKRVAEDGAATGLLSEDLLRRIERLSLKIRRPLPGGPAGEHLGRGQGTSIEFADHRPYSPGDDYRRIDWNALARLDELTIRVTEPREDVGLYVILDCSSSMASGDGAKARVARQLAAGLAYLALNQLDVVRVYALGNGMVSRSPRFTGRKQAADVFRLLRGLPVVPSTDLGAGFAGFLADRPARGLVVVLSDLLIGSDYRRGLRRVVQMGFEVALVHVLSEAELNPRLTGDVELIDSETAETIKISMRLDTLSSYRRDVERWQQD